MRTTKLMLAMCVVAMTAISCGPKKEAQKVLVLYYSQTGNTKAVAEEIASRLGADIEAIEAVNPYDADFQATIARSAQEREQGILPDIKPVAAKVADYDVIFLGYPVWFGTYAPPVATWLEQVDLCCKKVVPFCTFGSGGLESSAKDLAEKQPKAEIVEGYGVRAARMDAMPQEVEQFLIAGGFIEGEYTAPAAWSEPQVVGSEEEAIFNAAVDGYPMLNAQATHVASRPIAGGTEYLFTAIDRPRDPEAAATDDKPANKVQVYVTVAEGQAPVFTKVVR